MQRGHIVSEQGLMSRSTRRIGVDLAVKACIESERHFTADFSLLGPLAPLYVDDLEISGPIFLW